MEQNPSAASWRREKAVGKFPASSSCSPRTEPTSWLCGSPSYPTWPQTSLGSFSFFLAIGTCLIPSKPSDTQDSAKAASFALMISQENQPSRNNSSFQAQDASFGPEQGQGYVLGRLTSTTSTMTCSADREAHTELQNFSI